MTTQLDSLRSMTVVVADTGDIDAIKKYQPQDATTNPSLILSASALPQYAPLIDEAIAYAKAQSADKAQQLIDAEDKLAVNIGLEILKIVPGRISTEVDARLSYDTQAAVEKARKLIALYNAAGISNDRILIKIASTWQGIRAAEILEKEGRLPDVVTACVGGGSNSIGMFADFIDEPSVRLVGVEAGGLGVETGKHASAMALGKVGVLHGMKTYLLQDDNGNIELAHSISAGLDYPGVGPEHAYLRDTGRAEYVSVTDTEAMEALLELCKLEGIIPAIESAHALAYTFKMAKNMKKDDIIVVCLSGRGDKDVHTVEKYLNGEETNK